MLRTKSSSRPPKCKFCSSPATAYSRKYLPLCTKHHTARRLRFFRRADPRLLLFKDRRSRALRRGIKFTIPFESVEWPTHCPILGLRLTYNMRQGRGLAGDNAASLDRINARRGYVEGNVAVMSLRANRVKNNASSGELRAIAAWMDRRGC